MTLSWKCEQVGPDPRPVWTATLGPATLTARLFIGLYGAPDIWVVRLDCGEKRAELDGPVLLTIGEAMDRAEPWAREFLREWVALGKVAGEALQAWDGEGSGEREAWEAAAKATEAALRAVPCMADPAFKAAVDVHEKAKWVEAAALYELRAAVVR